MLAADDAARRTVQRGVPSAWRNVVQCCRSAPPSRATSPSSGGAPATASWSTASPCSRSLRRTPVSRSTASPRRHADIGRPTRPGSPRELWVDGPARSACLREVPRFTDPADAVASGSLLAPMPGTVVTRRRGGGGRGRRGRCRPRPRGDEDAAHRDRAARRHGHRDQRRARCAGRVPGRSWQWWRNTHDQLHRVRGAAGAARGRSPSCRASTAASSSPRRRAPVRRPPTCGSRSARPATSASTSPRSTAAAAAASATSPRSARSSAAQGCPLLMMVVSPAICGTIITRYGTEEQKQRWLPGIADGTEHDGLRDHRARRRHQLPQHHHHRPPRRRRVGAQRARRSTSPASTRPTNVLVVAAHRGREDRQAQAAACSCVPTDAAGLRVHRDPDGDRQPGEAVPGVHRRRPAARRRAGRRRGRRAGAALRRPQPGADHGGRVLDRAGPLRPRARRRRTPRSARSSRPPIGSHQGDRAPAGEDPHRDRAGAADDPEGRRAVRRRRRHGRGRGGQHGQVRRRRGRLRRRRPRGADPRRQRASPRSTAWPACSSPPAPAGSPRSAGR